MRAARFYAAKDIRVEEIRAPQPDDSDNNDKVLVEVEWCGICGSDLNEYLLGPFAIPSPRTGAHPLTKDILPVTMGHELTGRITHIPQTLSTQTTGNGIPLRKGQAVVVDPRFFCASCNPCTQAATNCCQTIGFLGLSGGGGGLAEVVAVRPGQVYALDTGDGDDEGVREEVDLAAAALIEPLAVAWHGFKLFLSASWPRGQLDEENRPKSLDIDTNVPALIIGAGPVGVAMAFVLRAWGMKTILVSEPAAGRREVMRSTGIATAIFDPLAQQSVAQRCREVTADGDGVGVVFDCAGSQPGFQAGCEGLRFRGVYVNLAVPKTPITVPLGPFMQKEITYKSSLAYDQEDFRETVDAFLKGRFNGVENMITRRIALEDIVAKGVEELVRPNEHIKILASPKLSNLA
ncbi:chaperonin 10-like protein [Aspergillus pseudoustus]|uniref:Chaperonin 10-like protein n=1 Tax=Aspergillus pseudoustus TaxID=1810923 RepID=A0ABR4IRV4_9EURO